MRNLSNNYGKKLLNTTTKTGRDAVKAVSKKPKPVHDENSRNVEEIITPRKKREEILNELSHVL